MQEHLPYAQHYCTYHSCFHLRQARQYLHTVVTYQGPHFPCQLLCLAASSSHPIQPLLPLYPLLPIRRSTAVRDYHTEHISLRAGSVQLEIKRRDYIYHEISEPNPASQRFDRSRRGALECRLVGPLSLLERFLLRRLRPHQTPHILMLINVTLLSNRHETLELYYCGLCPSHRVMSHCL
jgi:hypothetical protein